ncbi:glycine betaine ABC transporter substrate-binding protein [Tessaracoccus flavus]|uniref:Glycine/betaine ABC transporter substrate-binding protein n=1 Tax=Tessaracoccus flavus TaxID=1610493 RepID=A0A1Q2CGZ2_9ACTN|nr:glycine betaine ABC transporter substrate-binding protein [Tessaracoccus flavus]AQP45389.1 glycine/betaine ABC transporter substrate-binding protein [Tessaracoccus flavus]SDY93445.1 glycine betaine/proline transport system substrate-binding protein [Tessaracoccus flavus]
MFTTGIRKFGIAALGVAMTATMAACGTDDTTETGTTGTEDKGTITLGFIPSWTDGRSTAYLLENKLEEMGYEVEMEELSEPGPLYAGLAQGDIDMYPSAWPEVTHASFMEEYSDSIEDLGSYYDNAKLTWAVPEYSEITSIEDIPDYADALDSRIIGIEPGAGLTKASQEQVIPQYGLDDWELVTSSTTAMLAELSKAVDNEEEIVVTLWRPFWANSEFGMRDLEDPEGALGEAEGLHFLARSGFSEDHPEAAEWISELQLNDEQYGALEDTVVNQYEEGQEAEAIEAWLEGNADVLPAS